MKNLLPSMEFEFEINVKGEDTGQEYKGKFKYHRLNIGEKAAAAKMKSRLLESLDLPVEVTFLYEMLSWLRYGLSEYPKWWKEADLGMNLYDTNVISEIYDKIRKFEDDWFKKLDGPEKKKDDK